MQSASIRNSDLASKLCGWTFWNETLQLAWWITASSPKTLPGLGNITTSTMKRCEPVKEPPENIMANDSTFQDLQMICFRCLPHVCVFIYIYILHYNYTYNCINNSCLSDFACGNVPTLHPGSIRRQNELQQKALGIFWALKFWNDLDRTVKTTDFTRFHDLTHWSIAYCIGGQELKTHSTQNQQRNWCASPTG